MNHAIHKITFVLWYFDELEKLLLLNAYSDREELISSIKMESLLILTSIGEWVSSITMNKLF